jgi:hypothetical protein
MLDGAGRAAQAEGDDMLGWRSMTWFGRRSRRLAAHGLLVAALGCGGSSFDGHVFRRGDLAFRVGPVPSDWHPIEVEGALIAYRDDRDAATVALNARCGLDGDDVPLEALTHHLFIHFTDRQLVKQERIELAGRAALRSELIAALDGVQMHYVVVVLKKDGCVYDFMRLAPNGRDSGGEAFERFVSGFETLG